MTSDGRTSSADHGLEIGGATSGGEHLSIGIPFVWLYHQITNLVRFLSGQKRTTAAQVIAPPRWRIVAILAGVLAAAGAYYYFTQRQFIHGNEHLAYIGCEVNAENFDRNKDSKLFKRGDKISVRANKDNVNESLIALADHRFPASDDSFVIRNEYWVNSNPSGEIMSDPHDECRYEKYATAVYNDARNGIGIICGHVYSVVDGNVALFTLTRNKKPRIAPSNADNSESEEWSQVRCVDGNIGKLKRIIKDNAIDVTAARPAASLSHPHGWRRRWGRSQHYLPRAAPVAPAESTPPKSVPTPAPAPEATRSKEDAARTPRR